MAERVIRRPGRVRIRRPLPPPPPGRRPVPHAAKKPKLASTGMGLDRLCAVCLGVLDPGSAITFCQCGKFFHMGCAVQVPECPFCGFRFPGPGETVPGTRAGAPPPDDAVEETVEEVFQCPVCDAYVEPDAETCRCGAVFSQSPDAGVEYLCPECGAVVDENSTECPGCGLRFDNSGGT